MDVEKKRKLVLHFDLRNTMIVICPADSFAVEQGLNRYLAGVAWGAVENGQWVCKYPEPSLDPPHPAAISYYKYAKGVIVNDRDGLKRHVGRFTSTAIGEHFAAHFRSMRDNLVFRHESHPLLSTVGVDGASNYHIVLPSFYKLVDYLTQQERDFAVVIRTFSGQQVAASVLECCRHAFEVNHPMFTFSGRSIPVRCNPGKVLRRDRSISLQDIESGTSRQLENELDIYNRLSAASGLHAYVDDYAFWQKNRCERTSGKPLWLNPNDRNTHHILFDDNIRLQEENSIVDLRVVSSQTGLGQSLSLDQCRPLYAATAVQVNLIESTANIDYFVDKVKFCEKKFDDVVQCGQLPLLL